MSGVQAQIWLKTDRRLVRRRSVFYGVQVGLAVLVPVGVVLPVGTNGVLPEGRVAAVAVTVTPAFGEGVVAKTGKGV